MGQYWSVVSGGSPWEIPFRVPGKWLWGSRTRTSAAGSVLGSGKQPGLEPRPAPGLEVPRDWFQGTDLNLLGRFSSGFRGTGSGEPEPEPLREGQFSVLPRTTGGACKQRACTYLGISFKDSYLCGRPARPLNTCSGPAVLGLFALFSRRIVATACLWLMCPKAAAIAGGEKMLAGSRTTGRTLWVCSQLEVPSKSLSRLVPSGWRVAEHSSAKPRT